MLKVYKANLSKTPLFIFFLFQFSGCSHSVHPSTGAEIVKAETFPLQKSQLLGVWLRKIDGMPGYEGYQFEHNDKLQFLNMFTIIGDHWQLINGDSITIWSYSGTSPEIDEFQYQISELFGPRLTMIPENAEPGYSEVYYRPELLRPTDRWIGRWSDKDGRYLDITPEKPNYRVVIGANTEINVYEGQAIDEQIEFQDNSGPNFIRQLPATEIESKSGENPENCLMIENNGTYCRSIKP